MNLDSKIGFERARVERQERYNPIRNLTPEVLTTQIEEFHAGYLAPFARTMEAIKRRDDTLQPASAKREKAPSRRNWEVMVNADLPDGAEAEAERHQEALTFFYNNLEVTNGVDLNERGGFSLLRRQMMFALGYKYAVHHIVWKPGPDGLKAELVYCPLWFFENRTGKLRFLAQPHTFDGMEMEAGEWLVSLNEGLMEVSAVAYMFKRLPLKDWLILCQDWGKPVVEGITDAPRGSEEWTALKAAVDALAADLRLVRSRSAEIRLTDINRQGEMPYESLVERMDRRLAAIWRGGDLGTVSRADGVGAEGQAAESDLLEEDDCEWLSDTLNMGLDKLVIENVFGPGTTPLAYVKVIYPRKQNVSQELTVDGFLRDSGAPLGLRATLERYGRTMPDEDDDLLKAPASAVGIPNSEARDPKEVRNPKIEPNDPTAENQDDEEDKAAANEVSLEAIPELVKQAMADAAGARVRWLEPLQQEIDYLVETIRVGKLTDAELGKFLESAARSLPDLFAQLDTNALADSLEDALGAAAVQGLRDAKKGKR